MLFITAFFFLACEILLRASLTNLTYPELYEKGYYTYWGKKHPGWYHTYQPDTSFPVMTADFQYSVQTNSLGHREREPQHIFQEGKVRAIILGDSYTEGVGVPYGSTIARHLQRLLDDNSLPVALYNGGISGSDPFYSYTILRDKLLRFNPVIVMLLINSSDYSDFIYRGGFERFKPDSTTAFNPAPWYEPLYRYSYIFRFILHDFFDFTGADLFMTEATYMRKCEEINREFLSLADSLNDLAGRHGFKMLFVIHPCYWEIINKSERSGIIRGLLQQLSDGMKARGCYAINIWDAMEEGVNKGNKAQYGFEHDGHYSSPGYQLMAQSLVDELKKNYPAFWISDADKQTGRNQ